MTQRRLASTTIVVVLALAILVAAVFGYVSLIRAQPVVLAFQVPKNYSGWLVVSWNCAGGQRLAESLVAGRRYEPRFSDDGSICLADGIPETGYTVIDYRYVSRLDDGIDDDGLELVASPFLRTGPTEVDPDVVPTSTVDPPIGGTGSYRYDIGWVEVRQRSEVDDSVAFPEDDLQLGDRCDLDRFMQRQFAEPATSTTCGPIPTRQGAGLSG